MLRFRTRIGRNPREITLYVLYGRGYEKPQEEAPKTRRIFGTVSARRFPGRDRNVSCHAFLSNPKLHASVIVSRGSFVVSA